MNTEERIEKIYGVKYAPTATPTPSITVGTQVRLTGVVVRQEVIDDAVWVAVKGGFSTDAEVLIQPEHFEVIRQPFKRGEVVWSCGAVATGIAFQVLADETDSGDVLLIKESDEGGNRSFVAHHSDFERRP